MTSLAGPFSEISNFLDFIHQRNNYKNIPKSFLHPILTFIAGFGFLGANVYLNQIGFHPLKALESSFVDHPYIWKAIWLDIACFNIRFKYYAIWVK